MMNELVEPKYQDTFVLCSCGRFFNTRSTMPDGKIRTEVCSNCHPFYTGKQRLNDENGQIAKFIKRYAPS